MNPSRTIDFIDMHGRKLRAFFASLFIVATIFLLALLVSTIHIDTPAAAQPVAASQPATPTTEFANDDPNVITGGLTSLADSIKSAVDNAGTTADSGLRAFEIKTVQTAQFIVASGVATATAAQDGVVAAVHGVGKGATIAAGFTIRTAGSTVASVATAPGSVASLIPAVFNTVPSVSALIRPAEQTSLPVIDPVLSAVLAPQTDGTAKLVEQPASVPASATALAPQATDNDTQWPLHGAVTTQFGVPELPYQAIHTGLDISDGNRPGITPLRPFKAGRVVKVIHSALGLGNHIVIDHGNGMTSVYGHMYSIAVQEGQPVDRNTILGTEGSTGVSTGTHLHFEVRINGQATNPRQYINGQP